MTTAVEEKLETLCALEQQMKLFADNFDLEVAHKEEAEEIYEHKIEALLSLFETPATSLADLRLKFAYWIDNTSPFDQRELGFSDGCPAGMDQYRAIATSQAESGDFDTAFHFALIRDIERLFGT
jgi:hypothetical protein